MPHLDLSRLAPAARTIDVELPNAQTQEVFETERASVEAASTPLQWLRPSDRDLDRMPIAEAIAIELGDAPETDLPVGAGRVRGLVLHKLMEEVLTGELPEDASAFAARARQLMNELVIDAENGAELPDPGEIAATALRTVALPEIAALRPSLIPEWAIYAMLANRPDLASSLPAHSLDAEQALREAERDVP